MKSISETVKFLHFNQPPPLRIPMQTNSTDLLTGWSIMIVVNLAFIRYQGWKQSKQKEVRKYKFIVVWSYTGREESRRVAIYYNI